MPFYGNSFDAVLYDTMALEQVEEVQIETDGVFKYILIELTQREKKGKEPREEKSKTIVRGFEWAEFHGDLISSLSLLMSAMHYPAKAYRISKVYLGLLQSCGMFLQRHK